DLRRRCQSDPGDANRQYSAPQSLWEQARIEAASAPRAVREYLEVLDDAALGAAIDTQPKFMSYADPAAQRTGAKKGPAHFAYADNSLIDTDHAVIVDVRRSGRSARSRSDRSAP
ncbi:hypothetical protein V6Z69_05835, partial [Cereibacter sphaeroides]